VIRVLVVEDDKLARKGLIHAMPWAEYGMVVVGEASSGQAALDFLAANEVDLALTDFAMPGMSGAELMREARRRFPALRFAVLTFHQELEYAQEAFRLGALDYIAKVQLEKEGFDEVLGRIRDRYLEEALMARPEQGGGGEGRLPGRLVRDGAYALLSLEEGREAEWVRASGAGGKGAWAEIGDGAWLWTPRDAASDGGAEPEGAAELASSVRDREGWALLELTGLAGEERARVASSIRAYRATGLFYDYGSGPSFIRKSLAELEAAAPAAGEEELESIEREALAFDWIGDPEVFARMVGRMRGARPPAAKLSRLLVEIEGDWNRIFCPIASMRARAPEPLGSWREAEAWLAGLRDSAESGNRRLGYAGKVVACVMRAARIVEAELGGPLLALDVARRVNMSRGYFCRCFKDLTGRPFNDYLQRARVERAKLLLLHTDAPLSQVA
jgi:two-component system, response regulator YesN